MGLPDFLGITCIFTWSIGKEEIVVERTNRITHTSPPKNIDELPG